jgi:hypothetical protein
MITTMFGDFPNERALRLEAASIARETTYDFTQRGGLDSVACYIERLLKGEKLPVECNLKQKIYGKHFSF